MSGYTSATAKASPLTSLSASFNGNSNAIRPATPSDTEAYTFSTSLRRSSVGADSNPFANTSNHAVHGHSTHSHGHPGLHSHHSHAFSHNAKPSTPSSHFALLTSEQSISELSTSVDQGLSSLTVQAIRQLSGPNEFAVGPRESTLSKFLKQFYESPLNLLLFGSAGVSALVGNYDDAVSISLAIIIVVTVGFVQEQRSEKSLEALTKLVPHYCHLTRDGRKRTELANILVPGDIVSFSVGDRIPADLRILACADLEIDESNLTGETKPARKTSDALGGQSSSLTNGAQEKDRSWYGSGSSLPRDYQPAISERNNIAFMGTQVKNGRGLGVVVATGDQSEFGVIFSDMLDIEERKTPLQLSMDELAKKLSAISFAVIGMICLIGVYQQRSWLEMFTIGVSLAVAAIPEGLPIVVTVTLALGVLRMSKRKAIVKKLPSVETLGSVSVICSDKTGTLTTNVMTVVRLYTVDDDIVNIENSQPTSTFSYSEAIRKLLSIGNLCNHSFLNEGIVVGQSTEVALMNVIKRIGLQDERERFTKRSEVPFNSEQKWQSVTGVHSNKGLSTSSSIPEREMVYMSGAIETILPSCRFYLRADGSSGALDASMSQVIINKSTELSSNLGARIVAMAYGPSDPSITSESKAAPENLIFAGFQGMLDPPRKSVAAAIASLNAGGVQVVMITGDSEATARNIARQLGIRVSGGGSRGSISSPGAFSSGVLTGREIDALSQRQLTERIEGISVFARTTPRHKMAIVEAFQSKGKIVAMTGDGVNDAPALKLADIGISMGKGGTDVAKEAADMILVDDNFATILPAVEEGKCIFYNIQNFLCFQLSTAVAALSLVTLSTALQLPTPLNPMQILFINILMDGPPSQSLGVDPVNRDVMQRPPRPKNAPVLTQHMFMRILFSASMIVLGTLFIYVHELSDGSTTNRDQTMTFTCFVFLDLVSAMQNRGLSCGLTQNRMLVLTCSISFTVQLLLVYFPLLQRIFQTEALSLRDLTVLLILAAVSATLHEMRRKYERTLQAQLRWVEDQV